MDYSTTEAKIAQLNKLIPAQTHWKHWQDTGTGFTINTDKVQKYISDNELAAIDERLPYGVRALMPTRSENHDPRFDIELTLKVWSAPFQLVTSRYDCVAYYSLNNLAVAERIVLFYGSGIGYDNVAPPGSDIKVPIMTQGYLLRSSVRKTWLNKNYPDWESRLALAQDLNLDAETTAHYLFNHFAPKLEVRLLPSDISP